jgi:hypothetical protein
LCCPDSNIFNQLIEEQEETSNRRETLKKERDRFQEAMANPMPIEPPAGPGDAARPVRAPSFINLIDNDDESTTNGI